MNMANHIYCPMSELQLQDTSGDSVKASLSISFHYLFSQQLEKISKLLLGVGEENINVTQTHKIIPTVGK